MSRRYNASRSETYEKVGEPLHIGYLKGSAKGFISKDIIMVSENCSNLLLSYFNNQLVL